jgi:hypothetical protein
MNSRGRFAGFAGFCGLIVLDRRYAIRGALFKKLVIFGKIPQGFSRGKYPQNPAQPRHIPFVLSIDKLSPLNGRRV